MEAIHRQDLDLDSLPQKNREMLSCAVRLNTPKVIPIASFFLLIATALAVIMGTALLIPGPYAVWLWNLNRPAYEQFRALGWVASVFLYAVGTATAAAAAGLLLRRKWAWWTAVAVFAVNCLGDIISLVVTAQWFKSALGLLVSGAFLFCLTRTSVRSYVR